MTFPTQCPSGRRALREFNRYWIGRSFFAGDDNYELEMELWRDAMNRPESRRAPALAHGELESFLRTEFPQVFNAGSGLSVEEIWHGGAQVRQAYQEDFIRPGGTISGPTMMAHADFAMYVAVLASIGPVPLAVTTNLSINFLRKPSAADLLAKARLMKLGKRLAVGEVAIRSVGAVELVAHATSTYSIPRPQDA